MGLSLRARRFCFRSTSAVVCTTLTALALHGPAPAQHTDAAHGRVFGRVLDSGGAPVAGATVHVLGRPWPDDERVGEPDAVAVESDADGAFGVTVRRPLHYTVWAVHGEGSDGVAVSRATERATAGTPVLLTLGARRPPLALTVAGIERWQERTPLRVVLRARTDNAVVRTLAVPASGKVQLPALPGARCTAVVLGKDGWPLCRTPLDLTRPAPRIDLPASRISRVAVVSTADGAPLEGVVLHARIDGRSYRLGALSDLANPTQLPQPAGPIDVLATAPGRVPALLEGPSPAELARGPSLMERLSGRRAALELKGGMTPAGAVTGRILLGEGVPAAGLHLEVVGVAVSQRPGAGAGASSYRQSVATDAEGRFSIHGLQPGRPPRVLAVLAARHRTALPAAWRATVHGVVPLLLPAPAAAAATAAGDLDLAGFCPLDLTVQTHDQAAASGASVRLVTADPDRGGYAAPFDWVADRRGHVHLLLPASNSWMVYADDGDGAAGRGFSIQRGRGEPGAARLLLTLGAPRAVRGVVVGAAGAPLADVPVVASFRPAGLTFPGKPDQRAPRNQAVAEWWTPLEDAELRYVMSKVAGVTRSGPDGRFQVAVPAGIGGCTLHAMDLPMHGLFVSGAAAGDVEYRLELTRELR